VSVLPPRAAVAPAPAPPVGVRGWPDARAGIGRAGSATRARRRRVAVAVALTALLAGATGSARITGDELPRAVAIAYWIMLGHPQPGWPGGRIPYTWGGGHGPVPGPSAGTCRGYQGSIRPCPAERTVGLDCSGFTRWVYRMAYGRDVLGPGNTDHHIARLTPVPRDQARPGDLVFFGKKTRRGVRTRHVGVYIGDGKMINALRTGTVIRVDRIRAVKGFLGYFRYDGSQ